MPGVNVKLVSAPTAEFNPTATGKWFCVQLLERGPISKPILVTSMTEFKELVGSRVGYSAMWDAAETFFEEGGSELFLGRVVGKTPVIAKVELEDSTKAKALIVAAESPGEWGNSLWVAVVKGVASESFRLAIYEGPAAEAATLVQESPDLLTQVAAVAWAEESPYVNVTVGTGTKIPAVAAAVALTGGTYDAAEVETANWSAALALFGPELGCGQVSAPGITSEAVAKLVEAHAEANNRIAVLDLVSTATPATLIAAALPLRTAPGARRSAAYAPWAVIPGLAAGAPRTVPYSAVQAGIFARNDASATPPPVGEAAAGTFGQPRFAVGLAHEWTRAVREELNNASVNVARTLPSGVIETYGNRTLVSPTVEPAWEEVSSARLYMFIWAEGENLLGPVVFKNIDPKNLLFSKVEGLLSGFLKSLGGMLWSYSVSTGPSVNTPTTIKAKEVRANIEVKPSEIAETAALNISVAA
jgi:hypothetical protein